MCMENREGLESVGLDGAHSETLVTANDRYFAVSDQHGIFSRDLDHSNTPRRLTAADGHPTAGQRLLVLSTCVLHLLAVSKGNQTLIYNLETYALQYVVPGVGRVVTSIAWAPRDPITIVVGVSDGSICLWSLNNLERPLYRLMTESRTVCHDLAFCPVRDGILASRHGKCLAIWSLHSPPRLLLKLTLQEDENVRSMCWNVDHSGRLFCFSGNRHITVWDVADVLDNLLRHGTLADQDDDAVDNDGRGVLGRIHDSTTIVPITHHAPQDLSVVHGLGEDGVLALSHDGHEILLLSGQNQGNAFDRLWRCGVEQAAQTIVARRTARSVVVVAASREHSDVYVLPNSLCQNMGRQRQQPRPLSVSSFDSLASARRPESSAFSEEKPSPSQVMYPMPVRWHLRSKRTFRGISKQLQHSYRQLHQSPKERKNAKRASTTHSAISTKRKPVTDSLELPKRKSNGWERTPMAFLSPSVPTQKGEIVADGLLSLEEPIRPRTHSASSLEILQSIATRGSHDSDSDDETFGGGLRGSGTFMPSGVNVPLPRACGAFFAPNGQLLIFFPPKARPPSNRKDEGDIEQQDRKGQQRLARLFPSFGNPTTMMHWHNDSDSEGSDILELNVSLKKPSFIIHPSSFPSQKSWNTKGSPVKSGFVGAKQHSVVVQVREIESLLPHRYSAIIGSRVLCNDGESGSDLCRHNATLAERVGLDEAAAVWCLLALLLDDVVPLETLSTDYDTTDIATVARRTLASARSKPASNKQLWGKLRWTDHPLGASWLAEKLIDWAEKRADLHMLAYMSAIMCHVDRSSLKSTPLKDPLMLRLPADGLEYSLDVAEMPKLLTLRPPQLPRSNSQSVSFDDSPTKRTRSSRNSSRNVSQPTTPHLESDGSTPPFPFPTFSRQGTKLSMASSTSPEYNRSSFSAVAKHYAQSITDRFSTYGSSPPFKKSGTSPSTNELSSSLPTGSGSWSKTVSFASTADISREASQLSRSYTGRDDGYDSDKTVEDGSLPHSPKSRLAEIYVAYQNNESFTDNMTGLVQKSLLTPAIAAKARLWQQAFAEQLRVWGMIIEATELERIIGLINGRSMAVALDGIALSESARRRKATCGICFCVITGLEQVCPTCLHSAHLACLDDYLVTVGDDDYRCVSGCGCSCADLAFAPMEWEPKVGVRKASLTDPRRWRARVQGDSW